MRQIIPVWPPYPGYAKPKQVTFSISLHGRGCERILCNFNAVSLANYNRIIGNARVTTNITLLSVSGILFSSRLVPARAFSHVSDYLWARKWMGELLINFSSHINRVWQLGQWSGGSDYKGFEHFTLAWHGRWPRSYWHYPLRFALGEKPHLALIYYLRTLLTTSLPTWS